MTYLIIYLKDFKGFGFPIKLKLFFQLYFYMFNTIRLTIQYEQQTHTHQLSADYFSNNKKIK